MPDSAIQTDVPATTTAASTTTTDSIPQRTARELAMDALETRHQQQMAESNGYDLPADDDAEAAAAKTAAAAAAATTAAEPADQLAAQLAESTTAAPAAHAPDKVRIKVDGVETDVPLDEVVRQYQKNSSADKRLNEATRLLREAQESQAQRLLIEQQEAAQRAQHAQAGTTAATNDAPAADELGESGKEFLKALFEGDEENALTALQKVIGTGRQQPAAAAAPTLDIDQITNAVTQHVQQKLVVESALAQNRADYPEMYADPDLEALALVKIQRLREQEGSDFFAALDAVSKDMAAKFGWGTAAATGRPADPAPTTSSNRTAKLEQKRGIDNVASVNTKTTTTEQQPENPSDVIAAMKAARAGG